MNQVDFLNGWAQDIADDYIANGGKPGELAAVVVAGYEVACSCGAGWRITSIQSTKCPDCGTEYDAIDIAVAAEDAY